MEVSAVPEQVSRLHCRLVQVVCVDGQTLARLPVPQAIPFMQAPQSSVPPQPLPITPQYSPPEGVQLTGVQLAAVAPQMPAIPPPPQVNGELQAPQLSLNRRNRRRSFRSTARRRSCRWWARTR